MVLFLLLVCQILALGSWDLQGSADEECDALLFRMPPLFSFGLVSHVLCLFLCSWFTYGI